MYLQRFIVLALLLSNVAATSPSESKHVRRLQSGAEGDKSILDTVNDFFFDEWCDRTEKDTSNLSDLSSWMSTLDPVTNLADITLPGTHHSAAYDLSTTFNPNDSEYQTIQDASYGVDLPDKLVAPWVCRFALTQSLSIAEQLQAGVRYFDLRADYDAETSSFRAFHLLFGLRIEDILVQIQEFIVAHPTEIIVVEMTELVSPSATAAIKEQLLQIILDTFGSALLPVTDSLPTVGDMQTAGTTVIVSVQDSDISSASELIWPTNGKIRNTFANSADLLTMKNYNRERLGEFGVASDQFLFNKLSWILTPDTDYIKSSILRGSLFDLAKDEANPALKDFAAENSGKQLGNILIVDYVETSPIFDVLGVSSKSEGEFIAESGATVGSRISIFALLAMSIAGVLW